MRRWLVLGWFLSLLNACAEEERKPLTAARPGNGGGSSRGGSSTGGDGVGATSGSGGSTGGSSNLGTLDPNQIYLSGSMSEGNTGAYALADVSDPDVAIIGFPGNYGSTTAKMLDGNLVYQTVVEIRIRRFVPERRTSARYDINTYPRMPDSNDPELSTEPCTPDGENALLSFLTSPDGRLVYECEQGWYEDGEELDTNGYPLFALGYDGLALVAGLGVLDLADGSVSESTLPDLLLTARSFEDGFYVVDTGDRLWEVSTTGEATPLGTYPDPPDGVSPLKQTSELGPDNALYEIGTVDLLSEVIIRRTVDGDSEVIYTEADNPNVRAEPFTSVLVTGP